MNDHERWNDTAAAYVLGAMAVAEREEFEAHLSTCAICREEVDELRPAAEALPMASPLMAPPPELKDRIMAEVEREAELLGAAGAGADRPERTAPPARIVAQRLAARAGRRRADHRGRARGHLVERARAAHDLRERRGGGRERRAGDRRRPGDARRGEPACPSGGAGLRGLAHARGLGHARADRRAVHAARRRFRRGRDPVGGRRPTGAGHQRAARRLATRRAARC